MLFNSLKLCALAILLSISFTTNGSDLAQWSRFDKGGHPDYLTIPSTEADVVWCVWHEGLQHQGIPLDTFRKRCAPMHKGASSKNRVLNASNNEISAILNKMDQYFSVQGNGGYEMLFKQLHWVLHHEGQRATILNLLDQGNYSKIRDIYHEYQSHNAHVEYMIFAASDRTLRDMIDQM